MDYREFKSKHFQLEIGRRKFIKTSLVGGISVLCLPLTPNTVISYRDKLEYDLSLDSPTRLFNDKRNCWCHPRAGIVPGAGNNGFPHVVHRVTHSDGLFLVYTRRGANNDHVARHRAPLFIAQVDII